MPVRVFHGMHARVWFTRRRGGGGILGIAGVAFGYK